MKWLSKIPFIGFIAAKGQLVLGYVLIAAVIVISTLMINLWVQNKELKSDNTNLSIRVASVEDANEQNVETIDMLRKARETDSAVITELSKTHKALKLSDDEVRKRVTELEKQNEKVKRYLDTPIPAELACLLYNTCKAPTSLDQNRVHPPAGVPTRTLLPPEGKPASSDAKPGPR